MEIIHDISEFEDEQPKSSYARGCTLNLVWEGLGVTFARHLLKSFPIVEAYRKIEPTNVVAVTDQDYRPFWGLPIRRNVNVLAKGKEGLRAVKWTKQALYEAALAADIAIIPIDPNDELGVGKPLNKLLLFWKLGIPVICSATPSYIEALTEIGFPKLACRNHNEWISAIKELAESEELRREIGMRGRQFALSNYGNEKLFQLWDHSILESRGH